MFIYPSDLRWPLTNPVFKFYQRFLFESHIHKHTAFGRASVFFSLQEFKLPYRHAGGHRYNLYYSAKLKTLMFAVSFIAYVTLFISCLINVPVMTYFAVPLPLVHCLYICRSPSHSLMSAASRVRYYLLFTSRRRATGVLPHRQTVSVLFTNSD